MYLSIKNVTPLEKYQLLLKFENNEERIFDVSPYLGLGKFSELKNVSLFNSVKVSFDTIEWANSLDLDPDLLYEKSLTVLKKHNPSLNPTRVTLASIYSRGLAG